MGARLRAELVISATARLLSVSREVSTFEIAETAGVPREFVKEVLLSLGVPSERIRREDLPFIIIRAWIKGFSLLNMALNSGWSTLEELVEAILREHGFVCRRNVRVKYQGHRYEVDVLAWKEDLLLCIDCKRWVRARSSSLRLAAINQRERCRAIAKLVEDGSIPCFDKSRELKVYPLVVALHPSGSVAYEKVLVISIYSLPGLLQDISPTFLSEIGAEGFTANCGPKGKANIMVG